VTGNETIVELMRRHVLDADEQVVRIKNWPDGIALTTDLRHFVAGPEPADWSVSQESWADDVVIAIRDDLIVEGEPERFGFLMLTDGSEVYLNDEAAVADLGRRLATGMDPVAYAEILVGFHPYSSAYRGVITEPDGLHREFGQADLPDVAPPYSRRSAAGVTLTFSSFARYRWPGGAPMLDLSEWTVDAPTAAAATWESRLTATGLRLEGVQPAG
jgi:hypothetical protein